MTREEANELITNIMAEYLPKYWLEGRSKWPGFTPRAERLRFALVNLLLNNAAPAKQKPAYTMRCVEPLGVCKCGAVANWEKQPGVSGDDWMCHRCLVAAFGPFEHMLVPQKTTQ